MIVGVTVYLAVTIATHGHPLAGWVTGSFVGLVSSAAAYLAVTFWRR